MTLSLSPTEEDETAAEYEDEANKVSLEWFLHELEVRGPK